MRIDDFDNYVDQGCKWQDFYGGVPEDTVPVERREEAERLLAEACAYFRLPPLRVQWAMWLGMGMRMSTPIDLKRCAAAAQAREKEVHLRDQYDPFRWGWIPDHVHQPTAIRLRADLPDYPLVAAVRYAATRAYQVWAGFDKQLEEAELHKMALETITNLPKMRAEMAQWRREGMIADVCYVASDGRKIRPLNPPWRAPRQ